MAKCSFCGIEITRGTGLLFVKKDGRKLDFCSGKCEKNMLKLGRKPREHKWTEENRRLRAQAKETSKDAQKKEVKK